ncbi:hypothetical protein TD95_003009 [Thielaviopsis punctulata]|uniref:Histone acetyltransferase ESA1 n=1 Tax=Thielaviopsis punctulata TaxID=72032 RepID=A0A0F4ZCL1_9PEZI|nr:hypothetical protein TD95_003009 [Thielaviopsis punctulata]
MAGGHGVDATVGSSEPRQKGNATPDTIRVGCIAMVMKDNALRRAEILSIKNTKSGRHFYCNFDNFNKRLDEWVSLSRIDFTKEVEWPNPEKDKGKDNKKQKLPAGKKTQPGKKANKRPGKKDTLATDSPAATDDADQDADQVKPSPVTGFKRDAEIEKLRTSGSMTQNPTEVSRIRNISQVQFGKFDLYPWYFSPYPEVYSQEDRIFICEMCLSYFADDFSFGRHRKKCKLQHPPGNEIYRDDYVSFFEIDGRRQRTWCRNLCLLSKMFLDHKTLYYDVDPFLFYVMASKDDKGFHIVGYFSKEKESADGYNVACILTLPQYQRKGYGRLLIQFSYELSKIENKVGSPEKPLSDLGLLSYRQYWSECLVDYLVPFAEREERVTIEKISSDLAMTVQDIEHTLQAMKMQVYHKQDHKIVIPTALLTRREQLKSKPRHVIDPAKIQWKPPHFAPSARTWAW